MNTEENLLKHTLELYNLTSFGSELYTEDNKLYGVLKNYGFDAEGAFCVVITRYSGISSLPIKIVLEG